MWHESMFYCWRNVFIVFIVYGFDSAAAEHILHSYYNVSHIRSESTQKGNVHKQMQVNWI